MRVDGETMPYIAGWGEDGALDAVTAFAKTIDELARRVEDVLTLASPPPSGARRERYVPESRVGAGAGRARVSRSSGHRST